MAQSQTSTYAVPLTQNTAQALEFRCLYTADVRRKQKRWQDGRLKFHTFNRRVMVYDERSNFVGDAHWREDDEFSEGAELVLERGGILVETGDCIGRKDQDLTELLDKRIKEKAERGVVARSDLGSSPVPPSARVTPKPIPSIIGGLKPKTLNSLLSTTGHYGRAIVPPSPFEQRQNTLAFEGEENGRPSKRRKRDSPSSKSGYASSLTGASLSLSSTQPLKQFRRPDPLRTSTSTPHEHVDIVDLTDDNLEVSPLRDSGKSSTTVLGPNVVLEKLLDESKQNKPRKKYEKPAPNGYAQNLTGAMLDLSGGSQARFKAAIPISTRDDDCRNPNIIKSLQNDIRSRKPIQQLQRSALVSDDVDHGHSSILRVKDLSPMEMSDTEVEELRDSNNDAASTAQNPSKGRSILREDVVPRRKSRNSAPKDKPPGAAKEVIPIAEEQDLDILRQKDLNKRSAVLDLHAQPLRIRSKAKKSKLTFMSRSSSNSSSFERVPKPSSFSRDQTKRSIEEALPIASQATEHLNTFGHAQQKLLQDRIKRTEARARALEVPSLPPGDFQNTNGLQTPKFVAQSRALSAGAKASETTDTGAPRMEEESQGCIEMERDNEDWMLSSRKKSSRLQIITRRSPSGQHLIDTPTPKDLTRVGSKSLSTPLALAIPINVNQMHLAKAPKEPETTSDPYEQYEKEFPDEHFDGDYETPVDFRQMSAVNVTKGGGDHDQRDKEREELEKRLAELANKVVIELQPQVTKDAVPVDAAPIDANREIKISSSIIDHKSRVRSSSPEVLVRRINTIAFANSTLRHDENGMLPTMETQADPIRDAAVADEHPTSSSSFGIYPKPTINGIDQIPQEKQVKVVNPATRGRKAAQKWDYAGRVPESVVPALNLMVPPSLVMPQRQQPIQLAVVEKLGFVKVSAGLVDGPGPWSRESLDLFDWKRPTTVPQT